MNRWDIYINGKPLGKTYRTRLGIGLLWKSKRSIAFLSEIGFTTSETFFRTKTLVRILLNKIKYIRHKNFFQFSH